MRILHTADWHLGRIFHEVHLTNDQACLIDQFIACAVDCKPDVILITGDIYDRAVPPPEAVKLLDDTLHRISTNINCKLIMIAGNHDSPDRISFGSRMFVHQGIYISGIFQFPVIPLIFYDNFGPVYFYPIPYIEPAAVRNITRDESVQDHGTAWNSLVKNILSTHPDGLRSVLCAHASVFGAQHSDSERPLSIGGSELVDTQIFKGLSFTALGHLHGRQWQGDTIHYSGSLMKYSFSEAPQRKSTTLIELDHAGRITFEYFPLTPRRDLRIVKGELASILTAGTNDNQPEDYIMAILDDKEPQLDAVGKLRQVYPNILHIERPGIFSTHAAEPAITDHRTMSDVQLFDTFFEQTTGNSTNERHKIFLQQIIDSLRTQERELP